MEMLNFTQNWRFSARVTLKFNGWPRKNNRTPLVCHFKLCASFCSHLRIQTGLIVWKHPNWDKICFDICDLGPLTLTFCMDITFDNGNNSWKFHDNMMTQTLWTRRSENDNTPQPLAQWTNSPFIGQQVGNCKSFTCKSWPITWPIYLPCTVVQGQTHCASNIISNSHPFHSKWVDPPNPEIQQFQNLTLKIQGQGHGWGHNLKS